MIEKDFYKQPTYPGTSSQGETQPIMPPIPKMIGPYTIESLLERGGMSYLYLGTHPDTKEPITVKVLSPKFLSHPEIVKRFTNEAEIIAMTNHPNIVQLYGYGEWEGGLYIAMEFVQGISMRQYILQTPVSLVHALDLIIDIAYALCHLHTHGVIHRDLKPENILISESNVIKVIDFGIAQILSENQPSKDERSQFIGTPIYMSPEQRESPESVSFASDIYSLGIIAYEIISGRLSHGQIHLALMPKGIQKILFKALQPKSSDRYQDVVDFIADLSAYRNSTALQKEKKPGDPVSELAQDMRQAQMTLVASSPPQWQNLEIGLAGHQGIGLSGIYYDFFDISQGSYGIIMGEASSANGADGVIYTAVLRGMTRSLCRLTTKPVELVTILNDIIFRDSMNQIFKLSYLVLDTQQNQLRYISCGYGTLCLVEKDKPEPIKISTQNDLLGQSQEAEFIEVTHAWNVGDTLIVNTFTTTEKSGPDQFSEEQLDQAIKESADRTPQKQVDSIMLRARGATGNKLFQKFSFSLASIKRKK